MKPELVAQALLLLDLASAKMVNLSCRPTAEEVTSMLSLGERIQEWLSANNSAQSDAPSFDKTIQRIETDYEAATGKDKK